MGTLNLGHESLITSPERDQFVALRRRYMTLGNRHLEQFKRWYPSLQTADALFEHLPSQIDAVFTDTTTSVATDLAAYGIYDVSEEAIRLDLEARAGVVGDGLKRVQDKYFSIIGKSAELEAQRNEARDSRGRLAGGGFGVEGAAQGIALAAVANAAIGLTHGLANLTAKAASALGDKAKKRDLLNDASTTTDLGDFFIQVALQGSELVAALVNKDADTPIFETVSGEQRRKSAAIVENARAGRVPEPELQRLLVQAIALDPFNGTAWSAWLDRFGDGDGSLGKSAEALGVAAVEGHKSHLMAQRRAALSWNTPEECDANTPLLEQQAEWLGYPFDHERARITRLTERLDRERRTFNGVEYTSLVELADAQQSHEEQLQRTVAGVVHETKADADDARRRTREETIAASSSSGTIGWMTLAYHRFRDTDGRSSRKEFLLFISFVSLVSIACIAIITASSATVNSDGALPIWGKAAAFMLVAFLGVSIVAALALQIRRFHDQDRPGGLILLYLVPYIGWIIVLGFMLIDGTPSDNRFGPAPKLT